MPMLCTSCQNRPRCVAAKLAEGDAALAQLLDQLKRCSLHRRRRNLWQRLWSLWQSLGNRLGLILNP